MPKANDRFVFIKLSSAGLPQAKVRHLFVVVSHSGKWVAVAA